MLKQYVDKATIWRLLQEQVPDAAADVGELAEKMGIEEIEVTGADGNRYVWRRTS